MKKAKLSDYYKIGDENFPIGLSASMIDVPLLKAMGIMVLKTRKLQSLEQVVI